MDILNFNKKLTKIAALTDISENTRLTILEKDLILSYIRELYDIVLDDMSVDEIKNLVKRNISPAVPEIKTVPVVQQTHQKEVVIEHKEPPVKKVEEPVIPTVQPKEVEVTKSSFTEERDYPKIQKSEPIVVENTKPASIVEKLLSTNGKKEGDPIIDLFSNDSVNDLSDQLAHRPVSDLTKSMGFNERLVYQKELFENNHEDFNQVLTQLNGLATFDDAKEFLITSIIPKHDWTSEKRKKEAIEFIKLVKRRFM